MYGQGVGGAHTSMPLIIACIFSGTGAGLRGSYSVMKRSNRVAAASEPPSRSSLQQCVEPVLTFAHMSSTRKKNSLQDRHACPRGMQVGAHPATLAPTVRRMASTWASVGASVVAGCSLPSPLALRMLVRRAPSTLDRFSSSLASCRLKLWPGDLCSCRRCSAGTTKSMAQGHKPAGVPTSPTCHGKVPRVPCLHAEAQSIRR